MRGEQRKGEATAKKSRGEERRKGGQREERKGVEMREEQSRGLVTYPIEVIFEGHGRVPLSHTQHIIP